MNRDGFVKIMDSPELTVGEKLYIKDWQYHLGGSFSTALWQAIGKADESNLLKLALGFPDEVQGFLSWTRGDLYQRANKIAGGDCKVIENEGE